MQKGFAPILIILLIGIALAAIGGAYYFGTLKSTPLQPIASSTPTSASQTPQATPKSTSNPSQNPADETANWKTHNDTDYNFQYPSDWNVKKNDYLNSTQITNKNQTITITISEGQYPYGYGGEVKLDTREIKIVVDNKEYSVKENTVNNKEAYVDFKLNTPKNHQILFGTGYPASCCGKTSLVDYKDSLDTILKILSTVKFTQ